MQIENYITVAGRDPAVL